MAYKRNDRENRDKVRHEAMSSEIQGARFWLQLPDFLKGRTPRARAFWIPSLGLP